MKWRMVTIIIVGLIFLGGVVYLLRGSSEEAVRTVEVVRTDVVQDVSFTGHLAAVETVDISFELSGRVMEVLVVAGQTVQSGQELMRQDPATVELELAQAQADLASASEQAKLVWEADQTAQQKLNEENEETRLKRRQAVIDAKAEMDQMEIVWERTKSDDGDEAVTSNAALATFKAKQSAYHTAQQLLSETTETIDKINQAAADSAALSRSKYFATTQAAAKVSGLSKLAAVEELARLRVAKSIIVSPLAGVVTSVEIFNGEYATAGQAVLTVATVDQLQITAQVPETDAVNLARSKEATVTLDALPTSEVFPAVVTYIAPAADFVEGVPTYTVELTLNEKDDRLKPGLTANVDVHIEQLSSALAIPRRAVANQGDKSMVKVLQKDGTIAPREVVTGLVGSDGQIEIIRGLIAGEQVVIVTNNE